MIPLNKILTICCWTPIDFTTICHYKNALNVSFRLMIGFIYLLFFYKAFEIS
jgi:hypothetical protein